MRPHLFHRSRVEYSDGVVDLIPLRVPPADPFLGFGVEKIWRITLSGRRGEIGQISYRDGESRCVFYYGHIGYHIDRDFRGHHYAYRACRLIEEEIYRSGKTTVVITCDPDNIPSRRTCERLGCMLEGTVHVSRDILERYEINSIKRRYIWRIGGSKGSHVCGSEGSQGQL